MWRLFKYQEAFRAKRVVSYSFVRGLLDKLTKMCSDPSKKAEYMIEDKENFQFEEIYIPGFNKDGSEHNDLTGLVFIKYDEKYNGLLVDLLKINKIWQTDKVTEEQVMDIKKNIAEVQEQEKNVEELPLGKVITVKDGDFKGLIGTIQQKISEDLFLVSIQIFGQEQKVELARDLIAGEDY